jgi:L-lactate utilization protein LutC
MKITKSQLKEMIREELKNLSEKKVPAPRTPDWHQHAIAVDLVRNPYKSFFGSNPKEAEEILKTKFKYTQADIDKLKE